MTARVLVSSYIRCRDPCPAIDLLQDAGLDVVVCEDGMTWPDEQTIDRLADADGLIAEGENINASTLIKADRLRIVARDGAGYDQVDLVECTRRGIVVTNTPGAMADAVADEVFGLLLMLARGLREGDAAVRRGDYEQPPGQDLASLCLGLVGCGHIGAEVVRRALAFRMRVLVHDPYVDPARVEALGAVPVDRRQLLVEADAISLHTPLTSETQELVDAAFLAGMKEGSYLINTARGGLVVEGALIEALRSGHLTGAGLDVQATEPPHGASLQLVRLPNVVSMPHCGSNTIRARERMAAEAARCVVAFFAGHHPDHVLNPGAYG